MSRAATALLRRIVAGSGAGLLRAWIGSLRIEQRGWEAVAEARRHGPVVVAFLHGRFLALPFCYPHDRPVGIMISPSSDGDMLAQVIEKLGRTPVRGSSRRDGRMALDALVECVRGGADAAIAVDGPGGPALVPKAGVVRLAQKTGAPLIPVVYETRGGWRLGTWDNFLIPRPGARARVWWGAPRTIGEDASIEQACAELETELRAMTARAEAWAGGAGDHP